MMKGLWAYVPLKPDEQHVRWVSVELCNPHKVFGHDEIGFVVVAVGARLA